MVQEFDYNTEARIQTFFQFWTKNIPSLSRGKGMLIHVMLAYKCI